MFLEGKWGTEPHHYLIFVEELGGRNLITTTDFFFGRKVGDGTSSLPNFWWKSVGDETSSRRPIFWRKVGDETSSLPNFWWKSVGDETSSRRPIFGRKMGDGTSTLPNFWWKSVGDETSSRRPIFFFWRKRKALWSCCAKINWKMRWSWTAVRNCWKWGGLEPLQKMLDGEVVLNRHTKCWMVKWFWTTARNAGCEVVLNRCTGDIGWWGGLEPPHGMMEGEVVLNRRTNIGWWGGLEPPHEMMDVRWSWTATRNFLARLQIGALNVVGPLGFANGDSWWEHYTGPLIETHFDSVNFPLHSIFIPEK